MFWPATTAKWFRWGLVGSRHDEELDDVRIEGIRQLLEDGNGRVFQATFEAAYIGSIATIKAYVRVRYGINLGSLTAAEEKEYWREFGLRLQAFLALAEPIAIEMYGRSFANLSQGEQAEVIRRVARDRNEEAG